MNINYRKGTMKDLDDVMKLIKDAIELMESKKIYQWDDIYPANKDLEKDIKDNSLFVGTIDNDIAVVFVLNQESDPDYKNANWSMPQKSYYVLHRLCVGTNYQNNGVGKKTMQKIEDILKDHNIESLRLDAYSKNPSALKLYKSMDYKEVGSANWRKGKFILMEKYI